MAQQSARPGRKTRDSHCALSTLWVIWIRSANSHTGPQPLVLHQRPDRWQHPTTQTFKKPLASYGVSTDGKLTVGLQDGLAKSRHSLLREGGMHLHAPKMFVAAPGLLSEIAVPAAFSAVIQMITSPIAAKILAARSPTAAGSTGH